MENGDNMITVGITKFVRNHTEEDFVGTRLTVKQLDEIRFLTESKLNIGNDVKDGYADFCKEVEIKDFPVDCPVIEITLDNIRKLVSTYTIRNEGELPYLTRYFPKGSVNPIPAHHITVIVYTKEQLQSEGDDFTGADYDIVTVLAQAAEGINPMNPYTMVRNQLGKDFGGSGAPIDKDEYAKAVEFWTAHAMIEAIE